MDARDAEFVMQKRRRRLPYPASWLVGTKTLARGCEVPDVLGGTALHAPEAAIECGDDPEVLEASQYTARCPGRAEFRCVI
nr:hypothetical protein [Microbacterium sp. SORGH_AS_0862]